MDFKAYPFCSDIITILWSRIVFSRHFVEILTYLNKMGKPLDFSYTLGRAWSVEKRFHSSSRQIASENVSSVFSYHAAVTAIDALIARLQSIDTNDDISSVQLAFKNLH